MIYHNPDPKDVSKEIRRNLAAVGITRNDVHVRSGWVIKVVLVSSLAKERLRDVYLAAGNDR